MGAQPSSGAVPVGFADAVASGDVAAGLEVFNTPHNMPSGQVWACSQCHSVTPDEARLIGPGLWNISVRGDTRVPGQDALTYVYTSIINPNAFHVVGESEYPVNLMPQGYDEVLTPDELANLVAYLYSLK
jgi:mono/diheme cytochrome c family protein